MNWSNFDECFERLKTVLRDKVGDGENANQLEIYGSYLSNGAEIKTIVGRIEVETQESNELSNRLFEIVRANEEPENDLLMKIGDNFTSLRLDIKSFFIFTKIFLDTLAKIIRLFYEQKGDQLPPSMTQLLENEKLMELDSVFAEELKIRMLWHDTFVTRRDEVVHYLGSIFSTTTRNGKLGFDLLGQRTRKKEWGTDTVTSITDYTEDTIANLSKVILHIYNKFRS
jgi:hypothetical protein